MYKAVPLTITGTLGSTLGAYSLLHPEVVAIILIIAFFSFAAMYALITLYIEPRQSK